MKQHKLYAAIFSACLIAVAGLAIAEDHSSASKPAAPEPTVNCEALRVSFQKWTAAYASRDLAGTMAIFADDLIFSFQGSPDASRSDLEKGYRASFSHPETSGEWVPHFEEVQCSGNLGFIRSTWRLEVKGGGKTEVKEENRSIDIFRRLATGEWRIFRSLNYPLDRQKR
jgi:uncharacterized protein (TIGR02246 family)